MNEFEEIKTLIKQPDGTFKENVLKLWFDPQGREQEKETYAALKVVFRTIHNEPKPNHLPRFFQYLHAMVMANERLTEMVSNVQAEVCSSTHPETRIPIDPDKSPEMQVKKLFILTSRGEKG